MDTTKVFFNRQIMCHKGTWLICFKLSQEIFVKCKMASSSLQFHKQCHIQMYFGTVWTVRAIKKYAQINFWRSDIFPCIIYIKTRWNSLQILRSNFFQEANILAEMHQIFIILGPSAPTMGGFRVSLNHLLSECSTNKLWGNIQV